jgi:hypothetical protein
VPLGPTPPNGSDETLQRSVGGIAQGRTNVKKEKKKSSARGKRPNRRYAHEHECFRVTGV